MAAAPQPTDKPGSRLAPYSVLQVVKGASRTLERAVGMLWVQGEVASLSTPSSGHIYFSLTERSAQLPIVMWRSDARKLPFRIEKGMELQVRGKLGIYERDGRFQLYATAAEPKGAGAQALALKQLREKLLKEGLFDEARKRRLHPLPSRIGVITARRGAAVADIIKTIHMRFGATVVVCDAKVQGKEAPASLVSGLERIVHANVDVVIIGRGGGSEADLSAFNDERLVRAIVACPVPVISAVGHEVDISLCDLAADARAATPTMAGELAVPVLDELRERIDTKVNRLHREMGAVISSQKQRVDQAISQSSNALANAFLIRRRKLASISTRLQTLHPAAQLSRQKKHLTELNRQIHRAAQQSLVLRKNRFTQAAARLEALSPLKVLARGYSLVTKETTVLTNTGQLKVGDNISIRFSQGSAQAVIQELDDKS